MPHVVVATAEPYGAYHLARLEPEVFAAADLVLTQWLPGSGLPQRPGWVPISRRADELDRADVVLVTGGGASPWTANVARAATARSLPVCYVELAWPSTDSPFDVTFTAAAAGSDATARTVESLCGLQPQIVGRPVGPARGRTATRRCLLLPIVSSEIPDGQQALRAVALQLVEAGWELVVCQHPREPDGVWADVAEDISALDPDRQLDWVALAVGTSTSRMLDLVAADIPVLRVACGAPRVDDHELLSACGPLVTPDSVVAAADAAGPLDPELRRWLVGPGGLSEKLTTMLLDASRS